MPEPLVKVIVMLVPRSLTIWKNKIAPIHNAMKGSNQNGEIRRVFRTAAVISVC